MSISVANAEASTLAIAPGNVVPDRRQTERRRPMLVLEHDDAIALIKAQGYTGMFIGHAHQGKVLKIEIPNPKGW